MKLRFFKILVKNLKLILRSKISFIVFFSPVVLLFLVGSIYSSSKIENLNIGFVDNISEDLFDLRFIDEIALETQSNIMRLQNSLECEAMLKEKQLHFCFFLSLVSGRLEVDIETDLSDSALAWGGYSVFEQVIKRSSEALVFDLLTEFINQTSDLTSKLNSSDLLFDNTLEAIDSFDELFEVVSEKLDSFALNSTGLDKIEEEVGSTDKLILMSKKEISIMEKDLLVFQSELDEIKSKMTAFEKAFVNPASDVNKLISGLKSQTAERSIIIETVYESNCHAPETLPKDQCDDLKRALLLSGSISSGLGSVEEIFTELFSTYEKSRDSVNLFSSRLENVKKKLNIFSEDIASFSGSVDMLKKEISLISKEAERLGLEKEALLFEIKNGSLLVNELSSGLDSLGQELTNQSDDLASFLSMIDPSEISKPIRFTFGGISADDSVFSQNFSFIFGSLVFLISVISAVTFILNEKKSIAISRNHVLPKSPHVPVSYYICLSVLVFLQSFIVILLFNRYFFEANPLSLANPHGVFLLLGVIFLFVSVGIFFGSLFNKFENGIVLSIALSGVLLLLSSKFIVIDSLSPLFQNLLFFNPFLFGENLIRSFFINRVSFDYLKPQVFSCYVCSLILVFFSSFLFKQSSKKLIG